MVTRTHLPVWTLSRCNQNLKTAIIPQNYTRPVHKV